MSEWWVYIIEKKGKLYVGITTHLNNRLRQHGNPQLLYKEGPLVKDSAVATQLVQSFEPQPFSPGYRYYVPHHTLAKVLIATGTTEGHRQAEDLLSRLLDYHKAIHNTRCQIEVTALKAMLYNALDQEPEALEKLERAITLAEPCGFIRIFLDLGPSDG